MKGGGTKREHLERIEKQTGRQQIPEFGIPFEGEHLWSWFWDLSKRRGSGFGASFISYTEIKSWLEVTGLTVYPWEIDIITQMDAAYMEATQELKEEAT